ncbi:MAG: DNA polymerase III subunit alpha [Planctomycetes bacterium]|nr:DNA polymerase III subunit alpha [Planctomycetota bacterium]
MIPLVVRSHYSLMHGTAGVERLCAGARARGYETLALTDADNLYGLPAFLRHARRAGLRPIVGAEVTDPQSAHRAVCLVKNASGYRNLCGLLTARHMDDGFALKSALPPRAEGLLVLTDGAGLLEAWHAAGADMAAMQPRRPRDGFGTLREKARRLGVPLAAVPDSYFLDADEYDTLRVLRAIQRNTCLSRLPPGDVAPPDAWLAPPAEYRRRFETHPETIAATEELAERCAFAGPDTQTVFPAWHDAGGRPAAEVLRRLAYAGAQRRYARELPEEVVERLEHELRSISEKGFADYFLVVREIVRLSPRICGRGSGAASIVAYCLGITNVCPLKFNLYFERFLNPGRTDPPDIDVDFAWDERDDVQLKVLARHDGHAAMVCNHVLFQPRLALREVAKVFGLPEREIARVVKRLPYYWRDDESGDDFQARIEQLPEMQAVGFEEPWPQILRIAHRIIGTPRHLSVHAGGIVVTPRPVAEYAPVQRAAKGVPILHWEKDGTEELGLVKIDLLGNRSLAVIRDAIENLKRDGCGFDETSWEPEDDEQTKQAVAEGTTMGCFYIESPAMRLLQKRAGRGDYEHLVIHSSMIRPAANEYIREYLRRLRGGAWTHFHPLLADVLEETYGIMVYQEQVSQAAMALADFDHANADRLRKILSKKDKEHELAELKERFAAGAARKGVEAACVEDVWRMILSFSGYSFCKPHSASYARVSFQAAYLKVHYPAEFMAAVISNQGGFYGTYAYVSEARRMGARVLPPDVNASELRWRGDGAHGAHGAMRVGLMALKDLSGETAARILAERGRRPFRDLSDFLARVAPDEREGRALVHAGACDRLEPGRDRVELLWALAAWQRRRARERKKNAAPLFETPMDARAPELEPTGELERLRNEFAVLGFLCDRHPMELFSENPAVRGVVKARELPAHVGRNVRAAGWLVTGKVVSTKHGDPMEFLTFEDETGLLESTFFPQAYARYCDLLAEGGPFVLEGLVEEEFGAQTLTVHAVERLRRRTGTLSNREVAYAERT